MAYYWIPGQLYLIKLVLFLSIVSSSIAANSEVKAEGLVCHHPYGCFRPFETATDMPLPMSPDEIHTKFLLFTTLNIESAQVINATSNSMSNSNFDASKKTKIIVHGFCPTQSELPEWTTTLKKTILSKEDVNVIIVDWVGGAALPYDLAVGNTRLVGAQIAHLIRLLMVIHKINPSDIHIIGFSLGAHVSGFAGKVLLKHDPSHKLGRITGLDPANPGFNFDNPKVRLDKTDAQFVDVIHTDAKMTFSIASGLNRDIGHADYWPNGGGHQPGCNAWHAGTSLVSALSGMTICDHFRAPEFFINSVNATSACDFSAYRCSSYEKFKAGLCARCKSKKSNKGAKTWCNKMGYYAQSPNTKKHVRYYLQTSENAPFCAKHYKVQIHWKKRPKSSKEGFRGRIYVTLHGEKRSTKEFALNNGVTFHIVPGKTSRFLISHDCTEDIGNIERVTFRWERPQCWTYFFCPNENVYLKRIKIIDLSLQKSQIYVPFDMVKNGEKDRFEVPANVERTYIRTMYPNRLIGNKESPRKSTIIPEVVSTSKNQARKTNNKQLIERISGGNKESTYSSKQLIISTNKNLR